MIIDALTITGIGIIIGFLFKLNGRLHRLEVHNKYLRKDVSDFKKESRTSFGVIKEEIASINSQLTKIKKKV